MCMFYVVLYLNFDFPLFVSEDYNTLLNYQTIFQIM